MYLRNIQPADNLALAAFALQSWIFARLIEVFRFTGAKLKDQGDFWSLMFFVLALCIAACYFSLGFNSNHVAVVSNPFPQNRSLSIDQTFSMCRAHTDANTFETSCATLSHSLTSKQMPLDR